jgi:hypothetical protein
VFENHLHGMNARGDLGLEKYAERLARN